ncbi:DUF3631 domain-containing protein [Kutzneria sp. CA-103260]|uniref:DUF3631 domain-containing protein n=1 Tax=Kutzneria sp. CA-103260 TaxID=2802641 RepID=UPI001BA86CF5|nr:DUF3631 domain-containing protein [Kutzneria sp. CA-103260]QUQ71176.1 hypothetical protein JJ691_89600 [Kutzneria sp. CA-103260]
MTPQNGSVDGAALLNELRAALKKYVILPNDETADAVTLWIAATHAQPAWPHAPRLVIRAPEKRCGKSRLLDVVEVTCHDPFITVNSSEAAIYRSVTEDPPTLLVDEADTIFGPKADGNEGLRGLLNAGHQRNRPTVRYDAAANRVEKLPTFAMAALAGIGAMPDTIEDRAVIVRMRRRAPGETVSPYRRRRDGPLLQSLRQRVSEWLRADLPTLERAEPPMPVEDRAADTWEPLVVVADHAGADWPDRARTAVLVLTAEAESSTQAAKSARLLADIRMIFAGHEELSTAYVLCQLNSNPEAPWCEYSEKGLTAAKLGRMLGEYDIRSANIRFPDGTQAKGFRRVDFADAWLRYCPAPPTEDANPEG